MGATVFGTLTGLAAYVSTIPGVKTGLYPAVGHPAPGHFPCILLYSSSQMGNSRIDANADGAMWTLEVQGQLLVPNQGDTAKTIEKGDKLITPIVDAFTFNSDGYNPAIDAIDAGGQLDNIILHDFFMGGITYAKQDYYGADLYWSVKFHRYPEATP